MWDLTGDGRIELVQLRGDGMIVAIDLEGRPAGGWPYATGAPASDGPVQVTDVAGAEHWYVACAVTESLTALSGLSLAPRGPVETNAYALGCFPAPGGGTGRMGVYPSSLVPTPKPSAVFFDPDAMILHPNPVRGDLLKVRYVLGENATMELAAFDLSGRMVASTEWQGNAGAAGETHLWSVSDLAPGVYVIRVRVQGSNEERSLMRKVAVVR